MSALFPPRLDAPRIFAGSYDATGDRITRTARTLEEAFGPGQRSSTTPLHLADTADNRRMDHADRIVTRASVFAGACLAVILIAERVL